MRRSRFPELSEDDPFYEFFRRFGQIPRPRGGPEREFEQQSVGSGFIISSDGYLITNAHVVDGADEVTVKLSDKREFKAKVIGADKRTDVALLKIEAKDLPKVTIGDPDKLKVGEWVVAIGKPFGLENTMTAGIVSAKGRDLPQENLVPFIQTDAAVNPGNSGGPLFNLKGEVVGINSLIFSRTGGYMGLSFADPDRPRDEHRRAAEGEGQGDARPHRRADPGSEQGNGRSVRAAEADRARSSIRSRRAVRPTRPASRRATSSSRSTAAKCARRPSCRGSSPMVKPGTKVTLTVWRKGAQRDLAVTVAELKEDAGATPGRARRSGAEGKGQAQPDGARAVRPDRRAEEGARREGRRADRGHRGTGARQRAAGRRHPRDPVAGTVTEAKSAEQVNGLLTKMEKGASVTLRLKRGEQEFFSTLKINNGE